jgi:hypothetical protein
MPALRQQRELHPHEGRRGIHHPRQFRARAAHACYSTQCDPSGEFNERDGSDGSCRCWRARRRWNRGGWDSRGHWSRDRGCSRRGKNYIVPAGATTTSRRSGSQTRCQLRGNHGRRANQRPARAIEKHPKTFFGTPPKHASGAFYFRAVPYFTKVSPCGTSCGTRYAYAITIAPTMAPRAIECQRTKRKIIPSLPT